MGFFSVVWHTLTNWQSLVFLVLVIGQFYVGSWITTLSLRNLGAAAFIPAFLGGLAGTSLVFAQDYVLSGRFLRGFYFIAIGATLVTLVGRQIMLMIAGLSEPEKSKKVAALRGVSGTTVRGGIILIVASLIVLLGLGTSFYRALHAHFAYSDTLQMNAEVALYIFCAPAVFGFLFGHLAMVDTMSSRYVDSDLRNDALITSFAMIVAVAVMVVVPLVLFRDYFVPIYGDFVQSDRIIYALFAGFFLLLVVPYWLGTRNYSIQRRAYEDFRSEMYDRLRDHVGYDQDAAAARIINGEITNAMHEIENVAKENPFYNIYLLYLHWSEIDSKGRSFQQVAEEDPQLMLRLEKMLGGGESNPPALIRNLIVHYGLVLKLYGRQLRNWDLRAHHVAELSQLIDAYEIGGAQRLKTFLEKPERAQRLTTTSPAGGALISLLNGSVPAVYTLYHLQIEQWFLGIVALGSFGN